MKQLKKIKVNTWFDVPKNFTGLAEHVNGEKIYYLNGNLHHEDGPAVEYPDGQKEYWVNGRRHRTDKPAVESSDGYKAYWVNDKLHRTNGPAVEWPNGYKEYWVNGEQITKEAQELLYFFMKIKNLTSFDKTNK